MLPAPVGKERLSGHQNWKSNSLSCSGSALVPVLHKIWTPYISNYYLKKHCFILHEKSCKTCPWCFLPANKLSISYMSAFFSLPEPSLYRLTCYFWLFFWRPPPLSLALLHEGQESLALAWSSQPVLGSWDLGELPAVPQCAGSPLSLAPATFNSAFLLQARPRIQYRGALCWEQRHTPLGVYTHIHTFINHWKRQDQRRKEEQTPLRCWAWLRVALDTDGCTQDNCCLLFMEGPSATLRALFIWRLLKAPGQEPRGKSKLELCVSTVCVQVCDRVCKTITRMQLCSHVQLVRALVVSGTILLRLPRRVCVVCSARG